MRPSICPPFGLAYSTAACGVFLFSLMNHTKLGNIAVGAPGSVARFENNLDCFIAAYEKHLADRPVLGDQEPLTATCKPRSAQRVKVGQSKVMINWNATREEHKLMHDIGLRALGMIPELRMVEIMMDLEACHCNGCPLDLERLRTFPDLDFAHDVFGIRRHINRTTGQLEDCFLPRCAKLEVGAA